MTNYMLIGLVVLIGILILVANFVGWRQKRRSYALISIILGLIGVIVLIYLALFITPTVLTSIKVREVPVLLTEKLDAGVTYEVLSDVEDTNAEGKAGRVIFIRRFEKDPNGFRPYYVFWTFDSPLLPKRFALVDGKVTDMSPGAKPAVVPPVTAVPQKVIPDPPVKAAPQAPAKPKSQKATVVPRKPQVAAVTPASPRYPGQNSCRM